MSTEFTLQRLHALIDAYGADRRRWPDAERAPAQALLDASADARAALQRARLLDAQLDLLQPPAPAPGLRERILARATPRRRPWRTVLADAWGEAGGWRLAGPALAAGLALGAGLGVGLDPMAGSNGFDEDTLMQMAQLGGDAGAFTDWIEQP